VYVECVCFLVLGSGLYIFDLCFTFALTWLDFALFCKTCCYVVGWFGFVVRVGCTACVRFCILIRRVGFYCGGCFGWVMRLIGFALLFYYSRLVWVLDCVILFICAAVCVGWCDA